VVRWLDGSRSSIRGYTRRLGQAGEGFDEKAAEEYECPEKSDRPDKDSRELARPVAHPTEE
jgi:hypothetical protein